MVPIYLRPVLGCVLTSRGSGLSNWKMELPGVEMGKASVSLRCLLGSQVEVASRRVSREVEGRGLG